MKAGIRTTLIASAMDRAKEQAWAKASGLGEFGAGELSQASGCSVETAQAIIKGWLVDGAVVETQQRGNGGVRQMVTVNPDFKQPALTDNGRTSADNMWFAARRLRTFSPTDLAAHATTPVLAVSATEAATYCRALLAAGYLRVSRKANPKSAREAIYHLVRDTGPRPPREKRVRAVVDANTGETHLLGGQA